MDPLGDPLTTRPIQTGWEFTFESYLSWRFGFIDNPDRHFDNRSVWTRTRTRRDCPDPLLTLHPSQHGTSSMGKHLLAIAHIAKLNKLTESEVSELTSSTIDETALAILKRQGSQGIRMVSSQRKFIFNSQISPILIHQTDTILQTASKGFSNFQISQRHLKSRCHVRILFGSFAIKCYIKHRVTAVIDALHWEVVLPAARTLLNIFLRE